MESSEVVQNCRCGFHASPIHPYTSNVLLELCLKRLKSGGEGIPTDPAPCVASGSALQILTSPEERELIHRVRQDLQDRL